MPIEDVVARVLAAIRSAWRFRWHGAAAAWVICLPGWTWVVLQPDVYEARARVFVDNSSVLRPILRDRIVPPDVGTQLAYVRQALLGREHLERVVRENRLDAELTSEADGERLLSLLRTEIRIDAPDSANTVYNISYRHSDPVKAVGVVETLLKSLIDTMSSAGHTRAATAEQFLSERIGEYDDRLQQAEYALADFKKRNADRLPGSEGDYFERMRAEAAALEQSRNALRLAETRRDRLLAQLGAETPVIPSGSSIGQVDEPLPNSLDARIRDYRARLDTLLLELTDRHPDVINVRETLARLERQRAEQLSALGAGGRDMPISSLDLNPIYQASRIALNQIEVEIDALEAASRDGTQRLNRLQELIDEVPEVEAELAKLNRDYDIVYEQYQSLVRSRETQELSRKVADTDEVEFLVIDPPLTDFEPASPNRLLLLTAVLLAAVGVGGGISWLLAQLRPVFSTVTALRETSGLPVLGVVTNAWESEHRLRRRLGLVGFAGSVAVLGSLYLAGIGVELIGPGLRALIVRG